MIRFRKSKTDQERVGASVATTMASSMRCSRSIS
jgi:hypothetical protein